MILFVCGNALTARPGGSAATKHAFSIESDDATIALEHFSEQAGMAVIYLVDQVRGIKTHRVVGEFTGREALEHLLHDTGLKVSEHQKTGTLTVVRALPRKAHARDGKRDVEERDLQNRPERKAALLRWLAGSITASTTSVPELKEEPLELSPFVVSAEEDEGYSARSTLAATRIRTELRDVGSSISVVTKKFLEDTNSNKAEQLLVYTLNTEVAGQGGNFLGKSDGKFLTGITPDTRTTTRVRGLAEADNTRDFFLTDIPWDSYNIGRIDLQRGPNSVLFGIGSPAGIINASTNPASFKASDEIEFQLGSFGSRRYTADFNQVIIPGQLALRLSLLQDDTKYRQAPAFKDDHRLYAAVRWDPGLLNKGRAHTSLRANVEKGSIDQNAPRNTPTLDALTPWFNVTGRELLDPALNTLAMRSSSLIYGGVGAQNTLSGTIVINPNGEPGIAYMMPSDQDIPPAYAYRPLGINTFDKFQVRRKAVGYTIDAWKATGITDRSTFDSFNHLLEGPNNFQFNDFEVLDVALSQTFLDDKLGIEIAYDRQTAKTGGFNYFNGAGEALLTLDLLTELPFHSPNPFVRQPMYVSYGGYGQWSDNLRENWRATAFGELNFADLSGKESRLARLFGKNTFTGLAARQDVKGTFANYRGYITDQPGFLSITQSAPLHTSDFYNNELAFYNYLGPALDSNRPSASGLAIQPTQGSVVPKSTSILAYNYATGRPQQIPMPIVDNVHAADTHRRYSGGSKTKSRVDSTAFVWQGYWLEGTLVPMFGYRTDEKKTWDAGSAPTYGFRNSYRNLYAADWQLPEAASGVSRVHSKTYSLVTHLPENFRQKLPGRLDVALIYNQSENIQPGAGHTDVYGAQVPDPVGKTKEYGVALTGMNDRVTLRVIRYETKAQNVEVGTSLSTEHQYLTFVDAWGQWRAAEIRDAMNRNTPLPQGNGTNGTGTGFAARSYGTTSDGKNVFWLPDGPPRGHLDATGNVVFDYTQPELDATYAKMKASVDDWFLPENQLPASVVEHWELKDYNNPVHVGFPTGTIPGGLQVTGDTISKGYEIELVANPIKGLNISLNAAKTSAKRTQLAQSFVNYVESRWAVFQGPAGDMRYWGVGDEVLGSLSAVDDLDDPVNGAAHGSDGWSARGQFRRAVMSGYWLFRALENSDVPELKPWTFNITGSYTFQRGLLKSLNVGASYRWQDRNVTGFPVKVDSAGVESYDVTRPFFGSTQGTTDLWIGYSRPLTKRINWRTQLNVRNALANDHWIRVTVNPDGSPAGYRIPEPRSWTWSNTLEF